MRRRVLLALALALAGCGGDDDGEPACRNDQIIHVGEEPTGIAYGAGSVWVTNARDATVSVIDPATCRVTGDPIRVGKQPRGIAFGEGAVWVANNGDRSVMRIDPRRRAVVGRPIRTGGGPTGIAAGGGSVWVTHYDRVDEHEITRIPTATLRPQGIVYPARVRRIREQLPAGVTVAAGSVWVANEEARTVVRVDPRTGDVEGDAIRVPVYPSGLAVRGDELWVAGDPAVSVIEARTGLVLSTEQVVGYPNAIAFTDDTAWVATLENVVRIAVGTRRRFGDALELGEEPVAIAAGAGAVWVANERSGTVTRFEP